MSEKYHPLIQAMNDYIVETINFLGDGKNSNSYTKARIYLNALLMDYLPPESKSVQKEAFEDPEAVGRKYILRAPIEAFEVGHVEWTNPHLFKVWPAQEDDYPTVDLFGAAAYEFDHKATQYRKHTDVDNLGYCVIYTGGRVEWLSKAQVEELFEEV